MSLTTIVALLQSALLLLSLAQSGSNLSQSFRDNAASVAQQAISQATLALSSSPTATSSVASSATTTSQYFTLPNGAVVDPLGNVISAAPTTNTQAATATPAPSATPAQTSNAPLTLSIALGQTSVATSSAYISWTTSIPASSKVFIAPSSNTNSPQVLQSVAGYSTEGFVNIPNLNPNTQYAYTIEAINGTQDQKASGTMTTSALPPPLYGPDITTNMQTNLDTLAKSLASSNCPSSPVIAVRPENGVGIPQSGAGSMWGVVASVSGNNITWTKSQPPTVGELMYLDVALGDLCVPLTQLQFTYSAPANGSADLTPRSWSDDGTGEEPNSGGGLAFVALRFTGTGTTTPQTITITATEPGGGTASETFTAQFAQ